MTVFTVTVYMQNYTLTSKQSNKHILIIVKCLQKMKRFKLILKGVLLWITAFAVMLFISGVDSIYDNGYFIHSIIVCVVLCYTCYKLISEEEFEILSLYKWFNKITGEESCEQ